MIEHCYPCHSETNGKLKGGLSLESKAGWQKGGDSGEPAIVPNDPLASPIIQAMRHAEAIKMPPERKLPDQVIADFVEWINLGAADPRIDPTTPSTGSSSKRADKSWWSLQPIEVYAPPSVIDIPPDWQVNPIDRFVYATLRARGQSPNGPADARTMIRRLTYDVTGLPPTMDEVETFQHEYAAYGKTQAVTRLVDRLLASKRYGEHWGRHWLDVVRFGESIGFERNVIIDDLWPFRDYVIQSFNHDKPFDRFIMEHIAGDVLSRDEPEVEIGSAFLVAGPYDDVGNQDPVAQANIRAATLDEIITATGSAFLGMTVNCCRCHHHKFDPIQMEDYYRLRAAFEGVKHGRRVIASKADREQHAAITQPLATQLAEVEDKIELHENNIADRVREKLKSRVFSRPKVDPFSTEERFAAVTARAIRLVMHAHSGNPRSAVGSRLVEFEVWSAEAQSRNVALASHGGQAVGEKSAVAEDFPQAYGPQFVIDGSFAEQWFVGTPAVLTINLAEPVAVDRIVFSNSRGIEIQRKGVQGETPTDYEILISTNGQEWTKVADSSDRQPWSEAHAIERLRQEVTTPEDTVKLSELRATQVAIKRQLASVPPLPQVFAGNFSQPQQATFVMQGGDPMKPMHAVAPASLEFAGTLSHTYVLPKDAPEGNRRLALAKWIASPDHPLTARVLANRVWHYHFGTGIVDSPSDFGYLGGRPSHPELLDWLASRLISNGWRLKSLHREILTSQTYLQASTFRVDAAGKDREARMLWRFPPRRLSAEEIRDTLLAISGNLNDKLGGPGFRLYKFTQNNVCTYLPLDQHGPETYRRAVYHQHARASVVDILTDFDFPDIAFASPRRAITTSPLQALTMQNHSFTLDMAKSFAKRVNGNLDGSIGQPFHIQVSETHPHHFSRFVRRAYQLALQREPNSEEIAAAVDLMTKHGQVSFCRALLNFSELIYIE